MAIIISASEVGNGQIGYHNLFNEAGATVTSSGDDADFPKENAYDYLGYDWWKPNTNTAWLRASFTSGKQANYMAIWGHDLADHSGTVQPQYSTDGGSTWIDADTLHTPADNKTIFVSFDTVNADDWRVEITSVSTIPMFAGIQIGEALVFPHNMEIGFSPSALAPVISLKTVESEAGVFIGGSKKEEGIKGDFTFKNLDPSWVRSEWAVFLTHAQTPRPFVFSWDVNLHGDEAVLAWVTKDVAAPSYHDSLHMQIALSFEGTL